MIAEGGKRGKNLILKPEQAERPCSACFFEGA